jgi:colanic acid/amylovoran biosynthesis glycosyltransferase
MQKMKIAICTTSYNAYSETFIKAQIDLLPASIILHTGWLPTQYNNGLPIQSVSNVFQNRYLQKIFRSNQSSAEDAIGLLLTRNKIDVVLAQYGPGGVAMLPVCKKYGIPLVVHFHGFDASEKSTLKQYKDQYLQLFEYSKAVVAVSTAMKNNLISLGCPEEKIIHITYGPNDIFFKNNPNFQSNTFFAIGRFVAKKAPYLTILAFNELLKECPAARLQIAGEGELLSTCYNMIKALRIEDKVELLGVITPEQAREKMANSLAFVQHSIVAANGDSEGTPLAILEAQAAALPVIGTYHAGIPEVVVDRETGYLVQETDIFGMKEAMKKVFCDRSLAKKLGFEGRNRIKRNFTMEMYINNLKNTLNESMNLLL